MSFNDPSNSLTCDADVVSNLLKTPSINITRDGSVLKLGSNHTLAHTLSSSYTGEYTCTVCIEVPEAGIDSHCNSNTVVVSSEGEC